MDLYPHQEKAVRELHNGSILWGDVGTGKSRAAVAYYLRNEAPRDVYVITTAKKRDSLDWEKEFVSVGIGRRSEDGTRSSVAGYLTVDSWNNIGRYTEVKGAFFIFDEQRLVGSGAWTKAFLQIAGHNRWTLLTATPGDTWLDYIPVFVANGFYKNRTDFKRQHVLYNTYSKFPKVDRYVDVGKLVRLRNQILVHMKYQKTTVRKTTKIWVDYDQDLVRKVVRDRWHVYEDRPVRNVSELFLVLRKVINSDGSRLEAVHTLLGNHPRLIIFYNFDYELEILRTLSDAYPVAEWNGHKHEEVPGGDTWVYLAQYTAASEAWRCRTTNAMCFYSLPYSYKTWYQSHGRIDSLDSAFEILNFFILISRSFMDLGIQDHLDRKKSFNESAFTLKI